MLERFWADYDIDPEHGHVDFAVKVAGQARYNSCVHSWGRLNGIFQLNKTALL